MDTTKYLESLDLWHTRKKNISNQNPKLPSINSINTLLLKKLNNSNSVVLDIGGSNHQYRTGNTYELFEQYYPLNIDAPAIEAYSNTYGRIGIVASAESMPVKDESVDCVITNAFLEHPEHPDVILEEIVRILKPGGIVVHNDAWFCRWWQRYGLIGFKSFKKMTYKEKLIYSLAKISEMPIVRFPPIILKRALREILTPTSNPIRLKFKKLNPNFELNLGADEHACSSIDPLDVVRFYDSRGFKGYKNLSFFQRVFFKQPHIFLFK